MAGFQPVLFESGTKFLEEMDGLTPGCVLLDVRMPGVDGMYLLEHMIRARMPSPIVMMTGHGDVPLAVKAIKLGAFDFHEYPFDDVKLVSMPQNAFVQLAERTVVADQREAASNKIRALTPRENEVLRGLMDGLSNKMMARRLDVGLRTIEMHRGNVMAKLGARSLSEVLHTATTSGLRPSNDMYASEARVRQYA